MQFRSRPEALWRFAVSAEYTDYDWLGAGIYFWENDALRAINGQPNTAEASSALGFGGAVIEIGELSRSDDAVRKSRR